MTKLVLYLMFLTIAIGCIIGFRSLYTQKKHAILNTKDYLNLLPYFLLLTFIVEVFGYFFALYTSASKSQKLLFILRNLYNYFTALEFCFYLWMLKEIISTKIIKQITAYVIFAFAAVAILNIIFWQGKTGFHSITYAVGCVLVMLASVFYFLELFLAKQAVHLIKQPSFWISAGLLFFYCCGFPIFCLSNFIKNLSMSTLLIIAISQRLLNILLYLTFIIAFLCSPKIKKSSQ